MRKAVTVKVKQMLDWRGSMVQIAILNTVIRVVHKECGI